MEINYEKIINDSKYYPMCILKSLNTVFVNAMSEAIKQSIPEILQIVADNVVMCEDSEGHKDSYGNYSEIIDKQSIFGLEQTIIKRMKL